MTNALKKQIEEHPVMPRELMDAEELRVNGKHDAAMLVCAKFMDKHVDFVPALLLAGNIMMDADRYGAAHPYILRAAQLADDESIIWNNLALCYEEMERPDEAMKCFIKSLSRNPNNVNALTNIAKLYNNLGEPLKAINCADKAIRLNPKLEEAIYNRGIALLTLGNWKEGWQGYEFNLGAKRGRRERVHGNIPRWTGDEGLTVIAYGEQGVGDEINFASCIPDLQKKVNVVIECDKRLESLFKRSFNCPVYGTRYVKGALEWPAKHAADATVAFGSLPGFFRNATEDFPGTPYLTPDPERCVQWKALLDSLGPKLKVGLAWTGGIRKTFGTLRSLRLEDLAPIYRQDATFISLQYKDTAHEVEALEADTGIKIHHWERGTQTKDMDDQAALMSQLDLVITVQQTAVHLGGALGVPTWAMIPKTPLWRYGLTGKKMPWYGSVTLYRQNDKWVEVIGEVARDLRNKIASK